MTRRKSNPDAANASDEAPEGFATIHATGDQSSISWRGEEYDIVDGRAYVPVEAVAELVDHGFSTKPQE